MNGITSLELLISIHLWPCVKAIINDAYENAKKRKNESETFVNHLLQLHCTFFAPKVSGNCLLINVYDVGVVYGIYCSHTCLMSWFTRYVNNPYFYLNNNRMSSMLSEEFYFCSWKWEKSNVHLMLACISRVNILSNMVLWDRIS